MSRIERWCMSPLEFLLSHDQRLISRFPRAETANLHKPLALAAPSENLDLFLIEFAATPRPFSLGLVKYWRRKKGSQPIAYFIFIGKFIPSPPNEIVYLPLLWSPRRIYLLANMSDPRTHPILVMRIFYFWLDLRIISFLLTLILRVDSSVIDRE